MFVSSVSLTTDLHSKAIMDPSSVQLFSNTLSVTEGGLDGAGDTLLLVFQVSGIIVVWSLTRLCDWLLIYGLGKRFWSGPQK